MEHARGLAPPAFMGLAARDSLPAFIVFLRSRATGPRTIWTTVFLLSFVLTGSAGRNAACLSDYDDAFKLWCWPTTSMTWLDEDRLGEVAVPVRAAAQFRRGARCCFCSRATAWGVDAPFFAHSNLVSYQPGAHKCGQGRRRAGWDFWNSPHERGMRRRRATRRAPVFQWKSRRNLRGRRPRPSAWRRARSPVPLGGLDTSRRERLLARAGQTQIARGLAVVRGSEARELRRHGHCDGARPEHTRHILQTAVQHGRVLAALGEDYEGACHCAARSGWNNSPRATRTASAWPGRVGAEFRISVTDETFSVGREAERVEASITRQSDFVQDFGPVVRKGRPGRRRAEVGRRVGHDHRWGAAVTDRSAEVRRIVVYRRRRRCP